MKLNFNLNRSWEKGKEKFLFLIKWKVKVKSKIAQSYLTLCDLMDCSLPASSIHGIL